MQKTVGIRFKSGGKIYTFDPQQIFLKVGDNVIVETARGLEYGYVAGKVTYVDESELKHPIKPIIRKANLRDKKTHDTNLAKAPEAMELCKKQVEKRGLDMKIIRAEYTFDATKIVFSFTADRRVDFRELVKDLASIFRIRIELRQVGVRDEAKMIGGVGPCGCDLCCHRWMSDFSPVSIKMAKEQGLSLNPGKISGMCGRLLCCLQYEHECYECALKVLPDPGQTVKTPDGQGVVIKLYTLKETVLVRLSSEDGSIVKEFKGADLTFEKRPPKKKAEQKKAAIAIEDGEFNEEELNELEKLSQEKFNR